MRVFGSSQATGRRIVPRAPAALAAALCTPAGNHSTVLIDLSRTGARLKGSSFPDEGEDVIFHAEKIRVAAELVWINGDECGVEFDTPIAADEVNRVRSLANFVNSARTPAEESAPRSD